MYVCMCVGVNRVSMNFSSFRSHKTERRRFEIRFVFQVLFRRWSKFFIGYSNSHCGKKKDKCKIVTIINSSMKPSSQAKIS